MYDRKQTHLAKYSRLPICNVLQPPNPCPNDRQRAFLARAAGSFARAINETSKEFIARFMPAMGNRDDASLIELSAATRIFAAISSPRETSFRPNVATGRPFGRIHSPCKDGKDRLRRDSR